MLATPAVRIAGSSPACTAFAHATLINPQSTVARDATVVACGERIESVGDATHVVISKESQIIDARGAFLIPGLWDMHAHLDQAGDSVGAALLSYGITSVRDVGSPLEKVRQWRNRTASGAMAAPRIKAAGVIFESPRFLELIDWVAARMPRAEADMLRARMRDRKAVSSVEEIERAMASLAADGVDLVKVRNVQSPELLYAFAAAAKRHRLPVAAHVLKGVDLARASADGVRSFEHYDQFFDWTSHPPSVAEQLALAQTFAKNRTAIVPTLVTRTWRRFSADDARRMLDDPRRAAAMRSAGISADVLAMWRTNIEVSRLDPPLNWQTAWIASARFFKLAHRNGVDILPGTDLGVPFLYPGASLIEELEIFVDDIGLTPDEALASATVGAAQWFGVDDDLGTIAPGKLADVVLLQSNPLTHIGNLRSVIGVMAGGRYYRRSELQQRIISGDSRR
jgi:imidazolonepropionase-like amidohydrolase